MSDFQTEEWATWSHKNKTDAESSEPSAQGHTVFFSNQKIPDVNLPSSTALPVLVSIRKSIVVTVALFVTVSVNPSPLTRGENNKLKLES